MMQYMLHYLAVKVGDVTTATQMVWVVVELHLLVCIAFLEIVLCNSHQGSCLSCLQAAVITAESFAIDIVVLSSPLYGTAKVMQIESNTK